MFLALIFICVKGISFTSLQRLSFLLWCLVALSTAVSLCGHGSFPVGNDDSTLLSVLEYLNKITPVLLWGYFCENIGVLFALLW